MYFVKWNEGENRLEASIGGHVTAAEANVFTQDIINELQSYNGGEFEFQLDYSSAGRLDQGVREAFELAQSYCKIRGARKFICIARDEMEIEYQTGLRLQQVLEGEEEYRLAAA